MEIDWSSPSGDPAGYEDLAGVLRDALAQAAEGKGKERHSTGEPFCDQPMAVINRWVTNGFSTGQGIKKGQEAAMFFQKGEYDRGETELLGAINYYAGAILWAREQAAASGGGNVGGKNG